MELKYDVVVVGAGAAGIMAAWEMALVGKSVIVLEARDRIGGRIHTLRDKNFHQPVELGAEFIHGNLKMTSLLLEKAGIKRNKVGGDMWKVQDGELTDQSGFIENYKDLENKFSKLTGDVPVSVFFENFLQDEKYEELRFSLKNYVEGYYAADITRASTFALRKELSESDDVQYRAENGYGTLIEWLCDQCRQKGVLIILSEPVNQVTWKDNEVQVETQNKTFTGRKILITVPIGVLQTESIRFSPALQQKMAAARALGFGPVIKTMLQFDEAFWKKDLGNLGFLFSEAPIPTWWTQYPKDTAMLTGWSGGPHALELKDLSREEIINKALHSLSTIFKVDKEQLSQKLTGALVANWVNDPYTIGGYSYDVVNGSEAKSILRQPEADTIFFAGEGLFEGPEIGTVEAALQSGRNTAHQIISVF